MSQSGFSLIELMVTVAIIGTLASIAVPNYARFATKAKYGRAKAEMAGMKTMIVGSRITEEKTLKQVTGSGCTACSEGGWAVPTNAMTNTNSGQAAISWQLLGFNGNPKDPWGGYYMLDENEGEFPPPDCRPDQIISAGPNFLAETNDLAIGGDDAVMKIEPYNNACAPLYFGNGYSALPPGYYGW